MVLISLFVEVSTSTPTTTASARPLRTRRSSVGKRDRVCLDSSGSGICQPTKRLLFGNGHNSSTDETREANRGAGISRPVDREPIGPVTSSPNAHGDDVYTHDDSIANASIDTDASYLDLPWPYPDGRLDVSDAFNLSGSEGLIQLSGGQVATVSEVLTFFLKFACGIDHQACEDTGNVSFSLPIILITCTFKFPPPFARHLVPDPIAIPFCTFAAPRTSNQSRPPYSHLSPFVSSYHRFNNIPAIDSH